VCVASVAIGCSAVGRVFARNKYNPAEHLGKMALSCSIYPHIRERPTLSSSALLQHVALRRAHPASQNPRRAVRYQPRSSSVAFPAPASAPPCCTTNSSLLSAFALGLQYGSQKVVFGVRRRPEASAREPSGWRGRGSTVGDYDTWSRHEQQR